MLEMHGKQGRYFNGVQNVPLDENRCSKRGACERAERRLTPRRLRATSARSAFRDPLCEGAAHLNEVGLRLVGRRSKIGVQTWE